MAVNILLHPVLLFMASSILSAKIATYTSRGSLTRYAAIPILALIACLYLQSLRSYSGSTGWIAIASTGGWDYEHYQPLDEKTKGFTKGGYETQHLGQYPGTRKEFGSEVTGRPRGAGLWWEVKNVPNFSKDNPTFVPTRGAFILVGSISTVATFFLHNWTFGMLLNLNRRLLDADHVALLSRLSDVSISEIATRFVASFGFWVVGGCLMQVFFSAAGVISAIRKPQDIHFWRPLFGSIEDLHSVRNFWGKFWHQTMRSGLETLSAFFAHDILRLPRQGLVQRYTKIFCSFFISGTSHTLIDMGIGLTLEQSGALKFFLMQACGIVVEDGVQALYKRYLRGGPGASSAIVERVVGYAWFVFFFMWTTPTWAYPVMLKMRREDVFLGWEALRPVLFGRPPLIHS